MDEHPLRYQLVRTILYMGLAVPLVVGSRAFVRIVQDTMAWRSRHGGGPAGVRRVLLVGAGPVSTLFLRERIILDDTPGRTVVVGLVDDDPGLRGRWVHGYRVFGGLDQIPSILEARLADQIVIVGDLPAERVRSIVATAAPKGVMVRQWTTSLQVLGAG